MRQMPGATMEEASVAAHQEAMQWAMIRYRAMELKNMLLREHIAFEVAYPGLTV